MKILMVSIFSSHFFNWTEQLKDSGHEIFWFDVTGSDHYIEQIDFVRQFNSWRYRWNYPGRYRVKRKYPKLYQFINVFNEKNLVKAFHRCLEEVQPDIVHSFAMYLAAAPILSSMIQKPQIKWVYSSWGSDLFYRQNISHNLIEIKKVLPHIDYLITDCKRDHILSKSFGFNGKFLGVFPGRGGYDLRKVQPYILPIEKRRKIIVKGYHNHLGKSIFVLKSLLLIREMIKDYEVVVFGCSKKVLDYCQQNNLSDFINIRVLKQVPHEELLREMGESLIYIGNSISDGIPNTLLEAIIMGAFPIQSNPGGATSEIINNGKNGFLIHNPEDEFAIGELIKNALSNIDLIKRAVRFNTENIKPHLERDLIKVSVLKAYDKIENNLVK